MKKREEDKTVKTVETTTTAQDHHADFATGHLISDKYKVLGVLGQGGMGTVYRVQQVFLQKDFALKVMSVHSISAVSLRRFQLEAASASKLNHPNLVQVHDFGLLDETQPYLVMDFVSGTTFAEHLKKNGPLPVDQVAPIFSQVCFGLLSAHELGIVHRDIKPGNLMLVDKRAADSEVTVKVVDFGIAKVVNSETGEIQALTRTGEIFGSPLYMSPEQCCGGKIDHRSDIYSLGCVLFEMLTGTPPHMGATALATMVLHESGKIPTLKQASLGADFPPEMENIVAKMLRREPKDRYQNMGLVAHALAEATRNDISVNDSGALKKRLAHQPTKISFTILELSLMAVAIALLAAAIGGASVIFWKKIPSSGGAVASQSPVIVPQLASTSEFNIEKFGQVVEHSGKAQTAAITARKAAVKSLLDSATPLHSSIFIGADGSRKRRMVFPSFEIGMIREVKHEAVQIPAKDIVVLPADSELKLVMKGRKPIHEAAQNSKIFEQIGRDDFSSLALSDCACNSVEAPDTMTAKERAQKLVETLAIASKWSHLSHVELYDFPLCDGAFKELNAIPRLTNLDFIKCTFASLENASQPFLSKLKILNLDENTPEVAEAVVVSLSSVNSLESLIIHPRISLASIEHLQSCIHLKTLDIDAESLDQRSIDALSKIKSLRKVGIRGKLTSEKLRQLSVCQDVAAFTVAREMYDFSEQQSLQSVDRRVTFF